MAKREDWLPSKKRNFENQLSNIVKSVIEPTVKSNSRVEGELLLNWNKILGAELSKKIEFKKLKMNQKNKKFFKLYISIFNRDTLEISHSKELIIERINTFLGYSAVSELNISNDRRVNKKDELDTEDNNFKEVIAYDDKHDYKDYGIEDEGLAKVLRNIERNIGDNNEK